MREIKFRGKHKNPYGDKWVHGYYALKDGRHVIIMPHAVAYISSLNERKPIPATSVEHSIDANTLGQYTGLKDKNGKEIYEGDIIQDEFYERKAEVVFLEGAFWLDYKKDFGVYNTKHNRYQLLANYDYEKVLEVIGNICDNPELLEE